MRTMPAVRSLVIVARSCVEATPGHVVMGGGQWTANTQALENAS